MSHPSRTATTIWTLMGKIAPGLSTKRVPMMNAKTASTIQIRKEMMISINVRVRGVMTRPAISPMERP